MNMTAEKVIAEPRLLLSEQADYLISMAARAPSVHNTQPWRFTVSPQAIDLYADTSRKLRADPLGREMLISCGAAVFGLRLAVRSLGYLPVVELLPEPARLRLLARVRPGRAVVEDATRNLIKTSLSLPGSPQVLLRLGLARTTQATARRPASELLDP